MGRASVSANGRTALFSHLELTNASSDDWDLYTPEADQLALQEQFAKVIGRNGGGAIRREWSQWSKERQERRRFARKTIAQVWAVEGRFFPFDKEENREWKRRREESAERIDYERLVANGSNPSTRSSDPIIPSTTSESSTRSIHASTYMTCNERVYSKRTLRHLLDRFSSDVNARLLQFPHDLSDAERKQVHLMVASMAQLESQSIVISNRRVVTVRKM
jgi:hypothetical protein